MQRCTDAAVIDQRKQSGRQRVATDHQRLHEEARMALCRRDDALYFARIHACGLLAQHVQSTLESG